MTRAKNEQQPRRRTASDLHRAASKRRYHQRNWRHSVVRASRSHDKRDRPQWKTTCSEYLKATDLDAMIEEQNGECIYCDVDLEYGEGVDRNRDPAGLTVERLLNEYPHYKSNCVLACWRCNNARRATYTWQEFEENHQAIKTYTIKKCPKCKTMKSRDDYHRNRTRASGTHSTCKICRRS
jgi:hypothetical protein